MLVSLEKRDLPIINCCYTCVIQRNRGLTLLRWDGKFGCNCSLAANPAPQPCSLTYIYLRVAAVHRINLDRPGGDSVQEYLRLMAQLGADPGPVSLLGPWGIAPADWVATGKCRGDGRGPT